MTNKKITTSFGVETGQDLINEISANNSSFYVFAAKHTPYLNGSDQIIPDPVETIKGGVSQVYDDMIFGKRVQSTDVAMMASRYDWTSNTVFEMYDDTNANLHSSNFYACVNVGSYSNIYKCLYNNGDSPSLTEPSGSDELPFLTPEDGYLWKYMCTANDYIVSKFSTNDFIPIIENTTITATAISGAIDVIAIDDSGGGYDNYLISSFESTEQIKVGGDPHLYDLGANSQPTADFYNGCLLLLTSGSAKNEYRLITDYYISSGRRIAVLESPFDNDVSVTDTFEIYPNVYVFDTSNQKTSNCIARAIINPTGNVVSYVDIVQRGANYRSATAFIEVDSSVPVTANASLRPIMPPPGGHGADVFKELGAKNIGISVKFVENESPFTIENDYRTIGLLKDPLFANVNIVTDESTGIGSFTVGESIYQYKPLLLNGKAELFANTTVTGSNIDFTAAISNNDMIIFSNGTHNSLVSVLEVSNSSTLILSSNSILNEANCTITYVKDFSKIGELVEQTSGLINLTNAVSMDLEYSSHLVGSTSGATIDIDLTEPLATRYLINGRAANNYSAYNQLTKYVGVLSAGPSFIEDEEVYQDSTANEHEKATAYFHSSVDANSGPYDEVYLTNTKNNFLDVNLSDGIMKGSNSGAQFTIHNKYNGDLVLDSGDILYLENLNPIARANNKAEIIKLFISY
jgi:hypothetical protein